MVNKLKQHLFFLLRIPSECIYAFVQSFSHWISGWSSGHSKCHTVWILNLHHRSPFLLGLISWTTEPEDRSQKIYNRDTRKTTSKIQVAHSWSSQEQPTYSCWPWFCQQRNRVMSFTSVTITILCPHSLRIHWASVPRGMSYPQELSKLMITITVAVS